MPIFDLVTMSGTANSQALQWAVATYRLRTTSATAATIATIAITAGTAARFDCTAIGRDTTSSTFIGERRPILVSNNAGTLSLLVPINGQGSGPTAVPWTSRTSSAIITATTSGANLLIQISSTSGTVDWRMFVESSVV